MHVVVPTVAVSILISLLVSLPIAALAVPIMFPPALVTVVVLMPAVPTVPAVVVVPLVIIGSRNAWRGQKGD
jgi:hypothetical protein